MAAHNWRMVRLKLMQAGIRDPMDLRSMHYILDAVEQMVLESYVSNDPDADRRKREGFIDRLYGPNPETRKLNGAGYVETPAGFEEDEVEAAFDAFMASA